MAKEIKTEILIIAQPEKVWSILTNFDKYSTWNPFIKLIHGDVRVGNKIIANIVLPDGKRMTLKPKILTFDANKEFSWLRHFLFPGIFLMGCINLNSLITAMIQQRLFKVKNLWEYLSLFSKTIGQ